MKVVLLMMVMVQMAYFASAQTPTTMNQMPQFQAPPCFSEKLTNCAKNFNYTKYAESSINATNPEDIEMPCCSEWGDEIKDNLNCVCNYASPYLDLMTDFFKMCKIDASADMCKGISSKTGSGDASAVNSNNNGNGAKKIAHSVGLLIPILLLTLTVFVDRV